MGKFRGGQFGIKLWATPSKRVPSLVGGCSLRYSMNFFLSLISSKLVFVSSFADWVLSAAPLSGSGFMIDGMARLALYPSLLVS